MPILFKQPTWKNLIKDVQTCTQLINFLKIDGIWLNNQQIKIDNISINDLRKFVDNGCVDLKFKENGRGFCPHCSWFCCPLNPSHKSHHSTDFWDNLSVKEKQLLLLIFKDYHP